MKSFFALSLAAWAVAYPHGPEEDEMMAEPAAPVAPVPAVNASVAAAPAAKAANAWEAEEQGRRVIPPLPDSPCVFPSERQTR